MERLLKLVHSKAAEEKQVLSSTENNTKRKVRNETSPSTTTRDPNKEQVEDVKEKEVVLVDFEKPPSSSTKVAKVKEEQIETAHLVDDDQRRLLEKPTIGNKTKVSTCDEAPASNKNHTKADVTTTDIETSTDKGRQLVNNNLREENNTGKTMLRNSDKEDTGEDTDVCESDVFEDKAVIRREKSISRGGEREGGPDFFERAYPILYEPLNSTSSIYDPSRETSFDPFRPDFGTKTTSSVRSSCVPDLSEITLVGDDVVKKRRKKELKSLKDFFKNNQDFQEYSDYIFVENMCKAEAGAPSAATSLKVLLSVASNKRILTFENITQTPLRGQFLTWFHLRNVCVVKEMHILWRKSLNGNCAAAFDILDKKEFARERVGKEERQL